MRKWKKVRILISKRNAQADFGLKSFLTQRKSNMNDVRISSSRYILACSGLHPVTGEP